MKINPRSTVYSAGMDCRNDDKTAVVSVTVTVDNGDTRQWRLLMVHVVSGACIGWRSVLIVRFGN